jgi:uncharacterized protein YneF (UPF0154 family)
VKLVRALLIYLLVSLLVGLAIGTWLRLRLERAPMYIGSTTPPDTARSG